MQCVWCANERLRTSTNKPQSISSHRKPVGPSISQRKSASSSQKNKTSTRTLIIVDHKCNGDAFVPNVWWSIPFVANAIAVRVYVVSLWVRWFSSLTQFTQWFAHWHVKCCCFFLQRCVCVYHVIFVVCEKKNRFLHSITLATAYPQHFGCCCHCYCCLHISRGHRVRARAHALTMHAFISKQSLELEFKCVYANWLIALCTSFWIGRHSGSFATTESSIRMYLFAHAQAFGICVCTYTIRLIASFFPSVCVDFSAEIEIAIPTLDFFSLLNFTVG